MLASASAPRFFSRSTCLIETSGNCAFSVITWLISTTGNRLSPALYLMGCALLSLTALLVARTRLKMR